MSIPKEPRQLMINVMYLVLTALLALNVSAEIFNAFAMVDKGLKSANTTLDKANDALPQAIKDGAKKKASLETYANRVDNVRQISKENTAYIKGILDQLIDESGNKNKSVDDGDYVPLPGGLKELKGKRNYDATTRLMVGHDGVPGKGEDLKAKMLEVKKKFLALVDEADRKTFELPIEIDDVTWTKSSNKKLNWSDYTFGHMPVGAVEPIFSKFINDTKASEAAVLNYLANKVGLSKDDVVLDKFRVVAAPKKSYILRGETYEADVFLSAAAGADSKTGISISVGGTRLATDADGIAKYKAVGSTLGQKKFEATASITNPVSGKTDTYKSVFEYEVGEKSATISASKMNVFYIGVDNPVEISAAGVSSNQIDVSISSGNISKSGNGTYNVTVSAPGTATVNIKAPGLSYSKEFRVKRIPDPVVKLGKLLPGKVGDGEFKAQGGLIPWLEGFDFDARCQIVGYQVMRAAKRQDAEINQGNAGGTFDGKSQALVGKAGPGDAYIFSDIKCKCPGDGAPRALGTIAYTIR
jgi:gliding motility-associated protein GldM